MTDALVIVLDPTRLDNPNSDIRYELPDALVARSSCLRHVHVG